MPNPKPPRDSAQLAKYIVDVATGALPNVKPVVDEAAVRRGVARAESLSPAKRRAIAKKGAAARWKKRDEK